MVIKVDIQSGSSVLCFQVGLEFRNADFCGWKKTRVPGKSPWSEDENREHSSLCRVGDSQLGYFGGGECSQHCATPVATCLFPWQKYGFPLAEERMKRKSFFSHTAGSIGSSVRGVFRSHARSKFSLFCCHPPLPDLPRAPALHGFFELF